jgi:hypothetical protein
VKASDDLRKPVEFPSLDLEKLSDAHPPVR